MDLEETRDRVETLEVETVVERVAGAEEDVGVDVLFLVVLGAGIEETVLTLPVDALLVVTEPLGGSLEEGKEVPRRLLIFSSNFERVEGGMWIEF